MGEERSYVAPCRWRFFLIYAHNDTSIKQVQDVAGEDVRFQWYVRPGFSQERSAFLAY